MCACNGKAFNCNAYVHFTAQFPNTILSCFVTHVPLIEHAPLLEYRSTEVNCNIYII